MCDRWNEVLMIGTERWHFNQTSKEGALLSSGTEIGSNRASRGNCECGMVFIIEMGVAYDQNQ
jgi:hypothetical protein